MNHPLLQKASIVLSPTGYAEDFLHSIKPAQSFSSELVTNGDFSTSSDWTLGTGWSYGTGVLVSAGHSSHTSATQSISFESGKKYKITINLTVTSGNFSIQLTGGGTDTGSVISSTGVHTEVITPSGNRTTLAIRSNDGNGVGSVLSISVVKQTDADFDFTRVTTATRVNESGLIETVATETPRINYTSAIGSILLEPSRTNDVTYSNDVTDSGNVYTNMSASVNQTTSPEGITNAGKLTESTANGEHYFQRTQATSSGNYYTVSFFAKYNGRGASMNIGASRLYAHFDLQLGTVIASGNNSDWQNLSTDIINYGNGWYRCIMTGESVTGAGGYIRIGTNNGSTSGHTSSYTGDGTSGIFIYGIQMEIGSYPTSLIHTSGSTVTRGRDLANNAGNSDLINSSEGVLYAEIGALADDGTFRLLSVSDGTNNNTVKFGYRSDSNVIYYEVRAGSSSVAFQLYSTTDVTQFHKVALRYKVNDFAMWVNGTQVLTDTSGAAPTGFSSVQFTRGDSSSIFYGKVKVLAVFKEALTDAELTTLTS